MNESTAPPMVWLRIDEVLELVSLAFERDDLERATMWMGLALTANDDQEPSDA